MRASLSRNEVVHRPSRVRLSTRYLPMKTAMFVLGEILMISASTAAPPGSGIYGLSAHRKSDSDVIATKIAEFPVEKEIGSLDFSPDGTRLATAERTGSMDQDVRC
jgi:hypothetical protein